MKTIKEIKTEIRNKYNAIPEKQISAGLLLNKIGRKYVSILNLYSSEIEKLEIEEFYNIYM